MHLCSAPRVETTPAYSNHINSKLFHCKSQQNLASCISSVMIWRTLNSKLKKLNFPLVLCITLSWNFNYPTAEIWNTPEIDNESLGHADVSKGISASVFTLSNARFALLEKKMQTAIKMHILCYSGKRAHLYWKQMSVYFRRVCYWILSLDTYIILPEYKHIFPNYCICRLTCLSDLAIKGDAVGLILLPLTSALVKGSDVWFTPL